MWPPPPLPPPTPQPISRGGQCAPVRPQGHKRNTTFEHYGVRPSIHQPNNGPSLPPHPSSGSRLHTPVSHTRPLWGSFKPRNDTTQAPSTRSSIYVSFSVSSSGVYTYIGIRSPAGRRPTLPHRQQSKKNLSMVDQKPELTDVRCR